MARASRAPGERGRPRRVVRRAPSRPANAQNRTAGSAIPETTSDVLVVHEGALYPALHRLERKGLLSEEWGESETGRQAKYYTLTPRGRTQLRVERKRWEEHSRAVARALAAA